MRKTVVKLWFVCRGYAYKGEELSSLEVFVSREAAEAYIEAQEEYRGIYYNIESRSVDVSDARVVEE